MASNTFSVYVKSPLFERIRELEIDVKEVCNVALTNAVSRAESGQSVPKADLSNPAEAQQLSDDASQIEYTLQYQPNLPAAQAMIDNVRDQGGWTISFSKDVSSEGFWLLLGHPRALNEDL